MTKKRQKKARVNEDTVKSNENVFTLYLNEVEKIPLLSKEEEEKTAILASKGDKAAREKLASSNLRFVISVAKKYQGKGLPLQDLVSEGNIGLLNAIDHFDVKKGYRFITYAVWWIRQAIMKAIYDKGKIIRIPANKVGTLKKIERTRQSLADMQTPGKNMDIREVAIHLDMNPKKAAALASISQEVLSLEEPVSRYGYVMSVKDLIEDESFGNPVEQTANNVLREKLDEVLEELEDKLAEIIRCRFGLGETGSSLTLKEVGDRYNLSRERVRQLEERAIGQLRLSFRQHNLDSYIA